MCESIRAWPRRFGSFALLGFLCLHSLAADKSGVGPNTISLPKGPGSIEGLGESFQPNLNTGTAKYGIGLKLPPGTAGHSPELMLDYEGGGGNGPLGLGWSLPLRYVQRRSDHGIPTYGAAPFPRDDTFITETKEELVPLTNGFWFCQNEGAFIRYQQVGDHWEGVLPTGTRLEFGLNAEGRVQDTNSSPARVFCWLLQRETDTHGNVILYSYTNFPDANNLNQKYLTGVAYGPSAAPWSNFHFATLVYEDRPDWFEDCRPGFIVRTGKRLKSILIGTQGPALPGHLAGDFNHDGVPDNLVRRYDLGYLNYAGTNSFWSLLAQVQPVGADGVSTLPAATFGYNTSNSADTLSAAGLALGNTNEPPFLMDNPLVDLVDLNGDGLPDILKTESAGGQQTAYLNQGQLGTGTNALINWSGPVPMASADGLANIVNLQSTADIAHLADMDGDGSADLVYKSAAGDVYYFPNQSQVAWGARQPMSVQNSTPPSPFGDPNVRTADLDFDKRMDIIQSIDAGGGNAFYRIWFNLGNQTYSPSVTVAQDSGFNFSSSGVQIADFNGDRVPDIAWVRPSSVIVTAGLGYGNFAAPITVSLPDYVLDDTQVQKAKLTDLNGDGLADLVLERAAPGELWYWLNLGNYTFTTRKTIRDLPVAIGVNAAVRWADLNGNGSTDLVYADSSASPALLTIDLGNLLNAGLPPNTLTSISNGIGRVTLVAYQPSTRFALDDAAAGHPWPDSVPLPVTVVSAVTNLDSLGHQYVTTFRYHNGYYDPVEKQFRGFASTEESDLGDPSAPTLVTTSFFDTGRLYEAMKGKLLAASAAQQDGQLFWTQTNAWTLPPVTLYTGTNGTNVLFAHPTGTVKLISELGQGTPRRLETEVAYDNYGNQTTNADYGIVDDGQRSAWNDERVIITQYALNLDSWLLREPSLREIQDLHGVVISRSQWFYDDETFSGNNAGLVTVGNLTLRREWINPSNTTAYVKAARTKYDVFGNPVMLLDPLASAPGGALDLSQGHAREVAYDPDFHTYPLTETIHVGNGSQDLAAHATYDQGFGTAVSSVDFNNFQTTYGYDVFGRVINTVKPGDTLTFPTTEYDYILAQPFGASGLINYVETRLLDKPPDQPPVSDHLAHYFIARQYTDGLGRVLLNKQEAGADSPGSPARALIKGAVQYNVREKASLLLNPCYSLATGTNLDALLAFEDISAPAWLGSFSQNGSLTDLGLAAAHKVTVAYDATLREVVTTNQDGTFRRTAYEPLLTRSYDENQTDPASPHAGASMAHYQDGLQRLVRTDERVKLNDDGTPSSTPSMWTTTYAYDVNDRLLRITDSQQNVKQMSYDGLRRKTFMNDPDRGTMQYEYDDASNLAATTDAKAQHISFTYDGLNRLLTETYLGSLLSPRLGDDRGEGDVNVAYHYDQPAGPVDQGDGTQATAQNTKGRLSFVSDGAGEEHTSYDARGRIQSVVKRIPDPVLLQSSTAPAKVLVAYKTSSEYDSLDRLTRLVYPDNDECRYEYNDRNRLARIVGGPSGSILSNIVYWPSDQHRRVLCGNAVTTAYDYDARLRLTSLLTTPGNSPSPLIAFAYTLDGVSNLKAIADQRPGSAIPLGDPRRNTQLFEYDDLYRLTRAQYSLTLPGTTPQNDGEINCRYDRIGNLLARTSTMNQEENGLPIVNLGLMESGGLLGRSNRVGRAPTDPPGPHALTGILNPAATNTYRTYPYDPNGNLTNLDGLRCTWDFKDRLVAVENGVSRTQYTYDHSDRRISRSTMPKDQAPLSATLYPNEYFELRDHDAPTKYVFNGATRVARVTGSLSANLRIQRLRVFPGWNLCSLAVTSSNTLSQLGAASPQVLQAAYSWIPSSSNWLAVTPGQSLPDGTVIFLNAFSNAVLCLTGTYSEPVNLSLPPGAAFLPAAGLEAWPLTNSLPPNVVAWVRAGSTNGWRVRLPTPLAPVSDLPPFLAPGQVVFVESPAPATLAVPDPSLRFRYYHPDHLGSSTVMTDAAGNLVEETAFFPFGLARNRFQPRPSDEPYGFAQKERDPESGLLYFGARYLAGQLSRFASPDPKYVDPDRQDQQTRRAFLENPQMQNLYSFALSNPLKFTDAEGLDIQWSKALEKDKDFQKALKILQGTDEGKRILSALENADVKVDKGALPAAPGGEDMGLATKEARYNGSKRRMWRDTTTTITLDIAKAKKMGYTPYQLANVIHHELRHAEIHNTVADGEDYTTDQGIKAAEDKRIKMHKDLDVYFTQENPGSKRGSGVQTLDPRNIDFQKEIGLLPKDYLEDKKSGSGGK